MREDGMRFSLDIVNEQGQHARARVSRDGMEVSGDSIMGLMMLAAARGTSIDIVVDGTEAAALADALRTLVGGRFGEPN
jgi:phosphocarrier protein